MKTKKKKIQGIIVMGFALVYLVLLITGAVGFLWLIITKPFLVAAAAAFFFGAAVIMLAIFCRKGGKTIAN
jgi:hypothetical protein